MRKRLNPQTSFMFNNPDTDIKLIAEYQKKYTLIDELLETHCEILDLVHGDLEKFSTGTGKESKYTSEHILRMLIVKWIEGSTYREVVIRVSESSFLRNFAKLGLQPMMDFTFLSKANKYIEPSTWKKVNAMLLQKAIESKKKIDSERLRVDSTLYETNIHYPTDSHLLWDSYRVLSHRIRLCTQQHPASSLGNRFHDRKAKKLYTYISTHSNNRGKRVKQKVRSYYRTLIERVEALIDKAKAYVAYAHSLGISSSDLDAIEGYLPSIAKVVDQSRRRILQGKAVPNVEKIFSIFEPHTELIKRGKSGHPVEFGHMVTLAQTGAKFISYYDVMETREHDNTQTDSVIENHKKQFGEYPHGFTADKNYYKSMEHIRDWEEKINTFSVCKKGNRNQAEKARESTPVFKELQKFRAGIEGSISVLKRAFGMTRCFLRGFKSFAASVGCLVFCHNLVLLTRL